ncbi:MAG: DUF342 domain-containing protein [Rhodocyclaceae bacterium]|nr:DUF342 domain-containing protein [Rhodocyclaceae bacterium]
MSDFSVSPVPNALPSTVLVTDIPLPSFVLIEDDGLFVDMNALDAPDLLVRFVDRVFNSQACLEGLHYANFLRMLFDAQPKEVDAMIADCEARGVPARLLLAKRIVAFPPSRQQLYRGLSLKGNSAEYFFEQVSIDYEEDGQAFSTAATLSFDEFVAAMWLKGLRYGIDGDLVRQKLAEGKAERVSVAAPRAPNEGADASIGESAKTMQRNDAPRLRHDGKVDLARYENRFPQVTAGQRLFKKLASIAGVPGRDVRGQELPPKPVKDFSLGDLAGPGTQVERVEGEGDYVVALMDGFLSVDADTGRVSVNDKIINKAGVSARTTGNLSLAGQEYEEHGEVQEKRVVEGHHMSFFANVFGNIISDGGRISIKRTLAGGSAKSPGGQILIEGNASRALLEAKGGEVHVKAAEGCLIIARKVVMESAILCDVLADEIEIGHSEGSALAGKKVVVKQATARRDEATLVSLLLPDLARFDQALKDALSKQSEAAALEQAKREKLTSLTAEPEMKTYMSIQPRIRAKELVLKGEQEANWQKMLARLAPTLRDFARLNAELQEIKKRRAELAETLATIKAERAEAIAAVSCLIDDVSGETLVRLRQTRFEDTALANLPAKDLRARLHDAGLPADRVFFGAAGIVVWPPATGDAGNGN